MSAVGIFSEQAANVADVISRSTNFQTEVGAANAAEALPFCPVVIERDEDQAFPCALVCDPAEMGSDMWGYMNGDIAVEFIREVEEEYRRGYGDDTHPDGPNPSAAAEAFNNWVGAVVADMMLEFRNGGNLIVQGFKRRKLQRSAVEEQDKDGTAIDYFSRVVVFNFGATK